LGLVGNATGLFGCPVLDFSACATSRHSIGYDVARDLVDNRDADLAPTVAYHGFERCIVDMDDDGRGGNFGYRVSRGDTAQGN
jgi:hypothetical protein